MARTKRISTTPDLTISVYKITFDLARNKATGKLAKKGYMKIDYQKKIKDQDPRDEHVYMDIVSIWSEEVKSNCIKCHAVSVKNQMQRDFVKMLLKAGGAIVNETVSQIGTTMQLLALQDGTVRYAPQPGVQAFVQEQETWKRLYFFDSKAFAVRHMLNFVGRYKTIGGLASISFDRVPDELLFECGFQKVPDMFGYGTPMWRGNPESMFETSYSERDRYIQSFLSLLQNSLTQAA